jgi:nickel transport protein
VKTVLVLPAALLAGALQAHSLTHSAKPGDAVIVELRYGDGSPFSYEAAEVYRPAESVPFLAGRTDANGRLAFIPDRPGAWRIRAFSEDGHGADFTVAAAAEEGAATPAAGLGEVGSLAVGLSVIFGVFGIWSLFYRKTRSK